MAGVVYAEFKKGYYSRAELGSLRQVAPIQLLPDANYQVSAYPVPAVDLVSGNGLQDVQIYCNTCHGPRYITMQPRSPLRLGKPRWRIATQLLCFVGG